MCNQFLNGRTLTLNGRFEVANGSLQEWSVKCTRVGAFAACHEPCDAADRALALRRPHSRGALTEDREHLVDLGPPHERVGGFCPPTLSALTGRSGAVMCCTVAGGAATRVPRSGGPPVGGPSGLAVIPERRGVSRVLSGFAVNGRLRASTRACGAEPRSRSGDCPARASRA